ncbi:MAG: cytochrome c3 family protein [Candidatus Hydrogenedentes bacterium]|nr:cytochrome c3 family protein [Candidatus Hydrogenedentota bacterium]
MHRKNLAHIRTNRIAGVLAFLGISAILAISSVVMSKSGTSPHDGAGTCSDCHLDDPEKGLVEGERVKLVKDVDTICRQCHKVDTGLTHPTNVLAAKKPPSEFPLDWAGKITCATCHYMHSKGHTNVTGNMIRGEAAGRALCERCHDDLMKATQGSHSGMLDKSHMGNVRDKASAGALFDDMSVQCLGCHDGTLAQAKSVGEEENGMSWQHTRIGLSHPIGVDYPPRTGRANQYRHVASLDPRIRLFGGKLGCCSCHELYSKQKHGLVMSNERSALCLQCHLK